MVEFGLRAVGGHLAVMLAVIPILVGFGVFSLPLFYVISLIGFLIIYELLTPVTVQPWWKRRLTVVAVFWLAGFGLLAGWQVSRIVSATI